jgi:deoxycytidylate deaminase
MTELQTWIDDAVYLAMQSPCRSKRGVVISSHDGIVIGSGFNHQPFPFECDGSEACNRNCGKTAIHAEQAAILTARESVKDGWMLHVKAKQGKPCSSMAPSCLECSKLILESGIAWMHLLHDPVAQMLPGAEVVGETEGFLSDGAFGMVQIRRYSAAHFHWLTAEYFHHIHLILPPPASDSGARQRQHGPVQADASKHQEPEDNGVAPWD